MTNFKHDDPTEPPARKPSLFEILNRPIHLPFGRNRAPEPTAESAGPAAPKPERFVRLRDRLRRTRQSLVSGLSGLFAGKKLDDEALEELESRLLLAHVGVEVTQHLMKRLAERVSRQQLNDVSALLLALREELLAILAPCRQRGGPGIPALCDPHGRGQRRGQNHHHRQTGPPAARRGSLGAAGRRRHLPRRGHRAVAALGQRNRTVFAQRSGADPPRWSSMRFRPPRPGGWTC